MLQSTGNQKGTGLRGYTYLQNIETKPENTSYREKALCKVRHLHVQFETVLRFFSTEVLAGALQYSNWEPKWQNMAILLKPRLQGEF